jgi:hypothetical protein
MNFKWPVATRIFTLLVIPALFVIPAQAGI